MKKARLSLSLFGLLTSLVLILAACGVAATLPPSPVLTPTSNTSSQPSATVPPDAQQITETVRQDLAERLNMGEANVSVVEVRPVDWPDTSLGCPQPGMTYAQVITPGYQIVLRVGGQEYTYHSGDGHFVLCENGEPALKKTEAVSDEMNPQETELVDQAKEDLINRLKIAPDDIILKSVEPVQWPDSSLGCPQPGMNYLMVVTPGYLIKLQAGDQVYEYHTGKKQVVYCENPKAPLPAEPGGEVDIEARLADLAKADLAQRLNITADQIQVISAEPVEWPDASLGCAKPGMMYAQVVTPGYQIILAAQGKQYDYRTDLMSVFLCK